MKNIIVIILLLVGGAFCVWAGGRLFPVHVVDVHYDTVKVPIKIEIPIEKVIVKYLPAKIHTIYVDTSTNIIKDEFASAETIFTSNSIVDTQHLAYKDTVSVSYHFLPLNYFSLSLGLQPRQAIIQKEYITKTVEVEHTKFFDFSIGGIVKDAGLVAIGWGLCQLTHKDEGALIYNPYSPSSLRVGFNLPILNVSNRK